jgi:hypothetical protein
LPTREAPFQNDVRETRGRVSQRRQCNRAAKRRAKHHAAWYGQMVQQRMQVRYKIRVLIRAEPGTISHTIRQFKCNAAIR